MKKQFFFSMLAGAAMLASCSSENVVAPENGAGNEYGLVEGQPAFISIGIAMPDGGATRANDDVDDGIADEYLVKSGRLVLFKGSTEANAKLWKICDLTEDIKKNIGETDPDWIMESGSTHITSSSKKFVTEIESPSLTSSEKLYAYVILNDKGNIDISSWTAGTTFPDFSEKILTAIGINSEADGFGSENTTNGFVMTSVPVATTAGKTFDPSTTGIIKTLTPIDKSAVYPTKEEAMTKPDVACCYVERAAVKVDMTFNAGIADPTGDGTPKIAVSDVKWSLGNVNSSSTGYFNTRQVDADWLPLFNAQASYPYRFVSGTRLFATGHENGYRTYFGRDVNYSNPKGASTNNLINKQVTSYPLVSGAATYTYENTFDENSQVWNNTTYVALKVILNGGVDFYTIDGQNNIALNLTDLKTTLATRFADQVGASTFTTITSNISSAISDDLSNASGVLRSAGFNETDVIDFILGHKITLNPKDPATGKVTYTRALELTDLKVNSSAATDAQRTKIESVIYSGAQTIGEKLVETIAFAPETVYMYEGGVTYYSTRISHFGGDKTTGETPWNTEAASYNDYDKIYPLNGQALGVSPNNYGTSRKAAWLGRWGIVRNNWYSIEISNVTGIGDAVPVDYSGTATGTPGVTPDDNPTPKYYIAAHIHILPWVKRTQSVEL